MSKLRNKSQGQCFSTADNSLIKSHSIIQWYQQKSKRVWFFVPTQATDLEFRCKQKKIIYGDNIIVSIAWPFARNHVVWIDHLDYGWGQGPIQTTFYLSLWTRWTWLHPDLLNNPDYFEVHWRLD